MITTRGLKEYELVTDLLRDVRAARRQTAREMNILENIWRLCFGASVGAALAIAIAVVLVLPAWPPIVLAVFCALLRRFFGRWHRSVVRIDLELSWDEAMYCQHLKTWWRSRTRGFSRQQGPYEFDVDECP